MPEPSFPSPLPSGFSGRLLRSFPDVVTASIATIPLPVGFWGDPPVQVIRISAQLYNSLEQCRYLAEVLKDVS